ncbi:MAG TPA: hypothetical protein EYG11_11400 [Candidatus Latescibacteria bacterium]|nr:hypothetical protein [Candidatus Latescibacterota bacterium]
MSCSTPTGHRKVILVGIDSIPATKADAQRQIPDQVGELLREFTDLVEFTADAVYLDVTYNKFDIPFGGRVAKMIKSEIKRHMGLQVSIGMGPNKFLARLAMIQARPNGLVIILPEQIESFLADLPISKLPGAGTITRQRLGELGIERISQLAAAPLQLLTDRLGQRGKNLWMLSQGRDNEQVTPLGQSSQLVEETTFTATTYEREEILDALRELSSALSGRLRRRSLRGRTISLRVVYPDRRQTVRTQRLSDFTDDFPVLLQSANDLLECTEACIIGVRELGIGLAGFSGEAVEQLDLFSAVELNKSQAV